MSPSSNSYTTTHCSPSYMVKSSSLFRDLAQLEACLNFYQALNSAHYHLVNPATSYIYYYPYYVVDPAHYNTAICLIYYLVNGAVYYAYCQVNNASPPV